MNTMQGDWRATVVNITHPQGQMKAQVRVNGMMEGIPDAALPWAEYLLPIGYEFIPCNVGDLVWVDFPYNGDTRRPRIKGAAMDWAQTKPNTAPEANGKGTAYAPDTVKDRPAAPKYTPTRDRVLSRNGILEVRTVGGGYMINNMARHASVGFNEAGDIVISTTAGVFIHSGGPMMLDSVGDMTLRTEGKMLLHSKGDQTHESLAKMTLTSTGNMTQHTDADLTITNKNMTVTSSGKISQTASGDFTQKGASVTVTASGNMSFSGGNGSMTFNGGAATFQASSFAFTK